MHQALRNFGCCFIIFVIILFYSVIDSDNNDNTANSDDIEKTANEPISPVIWVSMSLCWDENARIYGKHNFPYPSAAQLSSKLWRNVTDGEVGVVLTIVHGDQTDDRNLEEYKDNLEKEGVLVVLEKTGPIGCVLQSQLSRMFVFSNKAIEEEDIILVSDVDIFIMNKRILDPLKNPFRTWIYR